MPVLDIIKLLWDAGKYAFDIAKGVQQKKEAERKKVSDLFGYIGTLLHDTYTELEKGNFPYGHCRQIEIFGQRIKADFKKELGEDEARHLGDLLIVAHEVESLQAQFASGAVSKDQLYKLEEASGEFIAASKLIMF